VPTICAYTFADGGHGAKGAFSHPHMGRCESSVLIGWDRI
jgi:hypothetical protein